MGIPASQLIPGPLVQLHLAGEDPARGLQAYRVLYPTGNPAQVIRDAVFVSKNFRNLDTKRGWVTGDAMEPSTTALTVAGTELVDPGEFRTPGGTATPLRPLVGRGFQVWALPGRQARDGKECHE